MSTKSEEYKAAFAEYESKKKHHEKVSFYNLKKKMYSNDKLFTI